MDERTNETHLHNSEVLDLNLDKCVQNLMILAL